MEDIIKSEDFVPKINLNIDGNKEPDDCVVSDNDLLDIYKEILENIRDDRKQVTEFIDNFADMVINEGDATSSSKEGLVNLIKIKSDMSDKMSKVADLMTRVKIKDRDTFPKYLAASQNNTININSNKRQLIEAINKRKIKEDEI
jgi:hypothetical protein